MGRVSHDGDLTRLPGVCCHSVRREESCSLPPVSLQRAIPEQSRALGSGDLWLGLFALGMASPKWGT